VSNSLGYILRWLCLAVPGKTVRWCTISDHEASKCSSFSDNMRRVLPADGPHVTCVKRTSHLECIKAIMVSCSCLQESQRKSILPFSVLVTVYCFRATFFPQELDHALEEKEIS
uniref:Transferrin-like domain-containing protein n=1 Tax=Ursus americanus TaxID=9643 RepID=A0A452QDX4_URSAM